MHEDSHQRKFTFRRRLLIGLLMKSSFPACRINEYLLAIKSLPPMLYFSSETNLQRRWLCTRDEDEIDRLKGRGAFPTVLAFS
jgi:hypothetical protein